MIGENLFEVFIVISIYIGYCLDFMWKYYNIFKIVVYRKLIFRKY